MADQRASATASVADRRAAVRAELAAGGVDGLRSLAERLAARGLVAEPDVLRSDLRALGVIRVAGADGPVLAVPVDRGGSGGSGGSGGPGGTAPTLGTVIAADADWPLQLAVLVVVAVFLAVAVVGWLIAP